MFGRRPNTWAEAIALDIITLGAISGIVVGVIMMSGLIAYKFSWFSF